MDAKLKLGHCLTASHQPSALPSPSSYYITCHCLQNLCVNKSLFVLRSLGQTVDVALEILRRHITSNVHIQREKQLLFSKPKGHFIISGQPHKSHFTMKAAIFRLQRSSPHHTLTAHISSLDTSVTDPHTHKATDHLFHVCQLTHLLSHLIMPANSGHYGRRNKRKLLAGAGLEDQTRPWIQQNVLLIMF